MVGKSEFFDWLRKHKLPYVPAVEDDFFVGSELLVIDLRRELDPWASLHLQGHVILVERIREDGMVYYRCHPSGKEECFVPMRNFFSHGTSVVVKTVSPAGIVHLRIAS